jgi:hypothetical protein
MIEPISAIALTHATIVFLTTHAPWLADKLGGATLTQAVRETWDLVRQKLTSTPEGNEALAKLASEPSTAAENLTAPLLAALQSDPAFAAQLSRLVISGSDNQVAIGDGNKQAKVTGSNNTVSIS